MEVEHENSLEYTPTWIVAAVCSIIVLLSLIAERALHRLGKLLSRKGLHALHEALQKLKDELMLLGFISLLLTVFQNLVSRICIPTHLASFMLPCKRQESVSSNGSEHYLNNRRLLSEHTGSGHCKREGEIPLLSLEALHQLHIFIFVLAVVHVIFCVTTMFLGGARVRRWKKWQDSKSGKESTRGNSSPAHDHHELFIRQRAHGYWRKTAVVSWMISFFKQFYGSITKSDYAVLRQGFIKEHFPNSKEDVDFQKYIMRTLEVDFKKVVGISWHQWLFVVLFLLLNLAGWNSYFWLSFLPLILLLLVGAKLEHIITRFAHEVAESKAVNHEAALVKLSDKHFWFHRPDIVLHLIHFILFQNSFEIAFFIWILSTYGFNSCIMEKLGYIVTRLIIGVLVQVLCSYSTMPLYAIVSMMGSKFKQGMLHEDAHSKILGWRKSAGNPRTHSNQTQMQSPHNVQIKEEATVVIEETSTSITELP